MFLSHLLRRHLVSTSYHSSSYYCNTGIHRLVPETSLAVTVFSFHHHDQSYLYDIVV
jgi:hypothetical protein